MLRQLDIGSKPLAIFFEKTNLMEELRKRLALLSNFFYVSEGNTAWSIYASQKGKGAGVGGEHFYYLDDLSLKNYKLDKYIGTYCIPLLETSDYMKFFIFTENDWSTNKRYLFLANSPRSSCPREVEDYIRLGETEIKLAKGPNKGQPVSKSSVANIRKGLGKWRFEGREFVFHDWYDLGGVVKVPIYATYGSRYWTRFVLAKFDCALDHRILALIPKENVNFDEMELKALLAFLNSSFGQLQAEVKGRTAGGVALLELDVKPLSNFLIPRC